MGSSPRFLPPTCLLVIFPAPTEKTSSMTIVEILLCIFLPPVAVALRKGAGMDLLINLVLWLLTFGILGIIHAFWLLSKRG